MVIFLDRTFGSKQMAATLRAHGYTIEVLTQHFPPDTPDTDWIPSVAARNWVIFTQDKNIRNRVLEREAVIASGARLFMLTNNNRSSSIVAELLIKVMPKIEELNSKNSGPFIAQIQFSGVVRILDYPTKAT